MAFLVDTLPDDKVIRAVFSGTVTITGRFQALQEIVALHEQNKYKKLLLDFGSAEGVARSMEESEAYAAKLAAALPNHRMKIAYVGDVTQTAGIESLAALRGYFYQRFRTSDEALRWLK
ncbi:MAG: hypothetical protein JWL98_1034 [Xanthomonadaceae bacterium]|nr:hypothetical protein [Xanthomonadaceae bacterium]